MAFDEATWIVFSIICIRPLLGPAVKNTRRWLVLDFILSQVWFLFHVGSVTMTKREIPSVAEGWSSTSYAVGKQPSIPLINLERKWMLIWWCKKCKCNWYYLMARPSRKSHAIELTLFLYYLFICQMMPLKVWPNTVLGCNHQSICMPQLQPDDDAIFVWWCMESRIFQFQSFQRPSIISTGRAYFLLNICYCYSCIFRLDTDTVSHCLESMQSISTEISCSTPSMDMAQMPWSAWRYVRPSPSSSTSMFFQN